MAEKDTGETFCVTTPEGFRLPYQISTVAERVSALAIDTAFVLLASTIPAGIAAAMTGHGWEFFLNLYIGGRVHKGLHTALFGFFFFLLRVGYFTYFELRRNGSTPGKKASGLQVLSRDGVPLTLEAVLARNLTREMECFLPFMYMVGNPEDSLTIVGGMLFALGVCSFPFFNRQHLRFGDILANTIVVALPPQVELQDDPARRVDPEKGDIVKLQHTFADQHFNYYGIHELQVLEKLLREARPETQERLQAVAAQIRRKFDLDSSSTPRVFLQEFYFVQRAHLESQLLKGLRKLDKSSVARKVSSLPPPDLHSN